MNCLKILSEITTLVEEIKATFDEARQPGLVIGRVLSADILGTLAHTRGLCASIYIPLEQGLQKDYERLRTELQKILSYRESSISQEEGGRNRSALKSWLGVIFPDRTNDELAKIHVKIQDYHKVLQAAHSEIDGIFDRIQRRIEYRIAGAENNDALAKELVQLSGESSCSASQLLRDCETILMENKPSDLEVRYLKVKLKILRSSMSEGGLKTGGINSNGESTSTHSRNSSSETDSLSSDEGDQGPTDRIRVLLQLLKYLRCGRDISLAEALPLVQRLIKTVEQLKMLDEAAQLSEWTLDISFGLLESGTGTYAQVSESFTHFAVRLTAAGHYGAAIAVAKDHVANCRKVSELEPTKWLPELALALRNQAAALHKLGRHNEEIKAIVESINAHERHAGYEEPTHFRSADYPLLHPHLNTALALNNLSRKLHSCSRYDDAVSASSASVEIFRRLSHTPSAENLSGLAVSYDILSSPLIGLERYEDAIKAMSESTDVYRKLAKEQPATYSADFARISGKLSTQLTNMGRYEETFKLLEDTISIHRQSIESDIPGLRNNLAASLIAASSTLCLLERYEEALTAATECVSNYRRLQNGSSTVFIVELAFGLERLAWSLHKLGHNSAAIPNLDEALQLLSSNKVDIKSDRYTLARGACLKTMTACLSHLGQHRRAIETGTEAAEIAYTLWTKNPHLYAYEMADYQLHKSRALHRSGELQMARTSAEMSVRMYKKLAKGFPLRYTEAADAAKEHLAELMMALEERENAEKLLDGSDCQSLDRTRS